MKKLVALLMSCVIFLSGCVSTNEPDGLAALAEVEIKTEKEETTVGIVSKMEDNNHIIEETTIETDEKIVTQEEMLDFNNLNDEELITYIEDNIYSNLIEELNNSDYLIDNVTAKYVSKEYLEELEYNSKENIFFGYTVSELEEQFQGAKYIFTLGDNGQTIVKEFESYDDNIYENIVKNVAIGTGVILICVTVSLATSNIAPAVSVIFAASAKTGTAVAIGSAAFSGVTAGVVTGIQTQDFDQAIKAAALDASESFKWGAFLGVIDGGLGTTTNLLGASLNGLTMNEAAIIQKESKLPLDFIKNMHSMEEYNIYKKAGLLPKKVGKNWAYTRPIDWKHVDNKGRTNAERVLSYGLNPLDDSGVPYELHHIGQQSDSPLAILTKKEHMQDGNNKKLHWREGESEVDHDSDWDKQKRNFWKALYEMTQ